MKARIYQFKPQWRINVERACEEYKRRLLLIEMIYGRGK